jgi:hypothetical protein
MSGMGELDCGQATGDSLPPFGGGIGWGAVQYGAAAPHRTTPASIRGDEFARPANRAFPPQAGKAEDLELPR